MCTHTSSNTREEINLTSNMYTQHTHACTHVHTHAHTHVHTKAHTDTPTCTPTWMHTHPHTRTYAHTCTPTHPHEHTPQHTLTLQTDGYKIFSINSYMLKTLIIICWGVGIKGGMWMKGAWVRGGMGLRDEYYKQIKRSSNHSFKSTSLYTGSHAHWHRTPSHCHSHWHSS
jgi:hypothetical protein